MMDKYFFELPVYRIEMDDYYAKQEEYLKNHYENMTLESAENNPQEYKKFLVKHEGWLSKQYGGRWRYNEIIGYIRLYFSGSQILGEYFQTDAQRIVKTRKKQFIYKTHKLVPEMDVWKKSNEEIYNTILEYIEECKNELKNKYIDTEKFTCIGKYIKWNNLLVDEENCIY